MRAEGDISMKAEELRDRANRLENAQARARSLLLYEPSLDEKLAVYDRVSSLAREWLKEMIDQDGRVSRHTHDAFEPTVLLAMWGDDLYNWTQDFYYR